ncbi:PAS domain-containing protein [Halopiger thermotolerans]
MTLPDLSPIAPGSDGRPTPARITVLVATPRSSLGRAPDRLEAALLDAYDDDGDFDPNPNLDADPDRVEIDIRTVPSFSTSTATATLLERLADADCLVLDRPASGPPSADVGAVLDAVRRRYPRLPAVVVSDAPAGSADRRAVFDAVRTHRLADVVRADGVLAADRESDSGSDAGGDRDRDRDRERLARRIRTLVERRRHAALSTRLLAAIELSRDAIAIAAPDGRLAAANCWFAAQFGYDRATLRGRSWRDFFAADAVAHLETTAIPTAADGWRWTGTCTGRHRSGESIPVRVRLAALDDGSLVFAVEDVDTTDADGGSADDAATGNADDEDGATDTAP